MASSYCTGGTGYGWFIKKVIDTIFILVKKNLIFAK